MPSTAGGRGPRRCGCRLSEACLGLLLASLTLLWGCPKGKANPEPGAGAQRQAVPVTVATVVQKAVPVEIRSFGNVEAYSTVAVKSQVEGVLTVVHIKEGQAVEANSLLLTIDPRSYKAAVDQAEANLARDTVQAKNAEVESRRTDALMKQGVATQDEYDKARTALEALQAAIRADDAALENARLKLEYCSIKSPIDGRVGSLFIDQGNLIKANDVKIVTINRIRPIYVTFTAPQQELPSIRERMAAGKLDVTAIVPKESQRPERGELTFIDNEVDTATGTIRLKATFANEAERLWPGQFVNVVLTLATEKDAIVAPSEAVQTGQQGQFVFVVKDDLTVEDRPVVVGRALDGETVIEKGLSPGQRVVTDGQLRLVKGAKVEITNQPATRPGASTQGGQATRPEGAGGGAEARP